MPFEIVSHTPVWVWGLLAYLVWMGWKARRPARVRLGRLALVPGLLAVMGVHELVRLFQPSVLHFAFWGMGLAIGIPAGMALIRRLRISVDADGMLCRPADHTALPLILATFALRYAFAAASVIWTGITANPWFAAADLVSGGFFVGIFAGKFLQYARAYAQQRE